MRIAAVCAAAALVTGGVAAPAHANPTPAPDQVAFQATFDRTAAGGEWTLKASTEIDRNQPFVLASGQVPASGAVTATIPAAAAQEAAELHYTLTAVKPTGERRAVFGLRSLGLKPGTALGGRVLDLGHGAVDTVRVYRTAAELPKLPAADCKPGVAGDQGSRAPGTATNAAPTGAGEPGTRDPGNTDGGTAVAAPDAAVSTPDGCTTTTGPTAASTQAEDCTIKTEGIYCLVAARDLYGRLAFRGNSEKSAGSLSTFKVAIGATQRWESGYRTDSSPFTISGTKTTTSGSGGEDTWARRGDCWGAGPNIEPCSGDGRWRTAGRDTWRWERHRDHIYQVGIIEYETLAVTSYDGGTEYKDFPGPVNYYKRPSSIRAGTYGSWAKYAPNTTRLTYNQTTTTHALSVSMTIDFPESMGTVGYSSSMTHERLEKVTNFYEFRGDLKFFNEAYPGYPAGQGAWYRYDLGGNWKYEYFSCEWAPGWVGGSDCWANGS